MRVYVASARVIRQCVPDLRASEASVALAGDVDDPRTLFVLLAGHAGAHAFTTAVPGSARASASCD